MMTRTQPVRVAGGEAAGAGLRVLIVEDHAAIRRRLRMLAGDVAGVVVAGAVGSVAAARTALATVRPDVVILDLRLPDGSGLDLLRGLERPRRTPRVIVLTNAACPQVRRECIAAGAEWCLDKSTDVERVVVVLGAVAAERGGGTAGRAGGAGGAGRGDRGVGGAGRPGRHAGRGRG